MRDFGKVAPTFWTRGSGKKLRGDHAAQAVALYLFTAPGASMAGLYYLSIPTLCHEVGMEPAEAMAVLGRLAVAGICLYDADAEIMWVPEMARYQIGASMAPKDKRIRPVARDVEPFRGHRFFDAFMTRYGVAYHLILDAPSEVGLPIVDAPSDDENELPKGPSLSLSLSLSSAPEGDARGGTAEPPDPEPDEPEPQAADAAPAPERRPAGLPATVRLGDPAKRAAKITLPASKSDPTECTSPESLAIHDRLKAHPSLVEVAGVRLAEHVAAAVLASGKSLDDALSSIDAAAGKAQIADVANERMLPKDLAEMVCNFAKKRFTKGAAAGAGPVPKPSGSGIVHGTVTGGPKLPPFVAAMTAKKAASNG